MPNHEKVASWGNDCLYLCLPGTRFKFCGLSAVQFTAIRKKYTNFVEEADVELPANEIECHVYRLQNPLSIPDHILIRDGIYQIPVNRDQQAGGFELTGYNFVARIAAETLPAISSLGVFQESDLVDSGALENYLRVVMAQFVLQRGGVELHSAGIVFDNKAYIFSGRSNAGKTTLTRKAFNHGLTILSDDINLLLPVKGDQDIFHAYSVPFTGEFSETIFNDTNQLYPVTGIILLEQADCLETVPVSSSAAVARLITACPFVNADQYQSDALFDVLTRLVSKVPVIRLRSRKDDDIDGIMKKVTKQLAA